MYIMTKVELLRMNRSLIELMSANGIKTSDISFIDIYDDFIEKRKIMKFSAAIMELSFKYGKSERTISRMMSKLQEDVRM